MIHAFDSFFWLARLPDGRWISAENHASYEPIFQTAKRIRIEPISAASIQAVLCADVPDGYTAFLRTDIHEDITTGKGMKVGYVMALERGKWPKPGSVPIGGFEGDKWKAGPELPLVDGFRAELQTWDGAVLFESSANFSYKVDHEGGKDIYKFFRR